MDYTLSLRINLLPNELFLSRAKEVIKFCKTAKVSDVMFFIDAEEYNGGHTTIADAKPYVECIKSVKPLFEKENISVSLNPWQTLGHADRGRHSPKNYHNYIGLNGVKSTLTACPLCENWQENILNLFEYYAKEISPKVLWIEDDFRMHNHAPQHFGSGCFCENHMRLYNARLNKNLTREEFVLGLVDKETNYSFRKAYMDVNAEIYDDLAKKFTEKLKKYNTSVGIMSSEINMYAIEGRDNCRLLKNFDLGNGVFNRVHLPMYKEISPLNYGWGVNTVSLMSRVYSPQNCFITPEVENYPHSYHLKSAKMTAFQVESSLPLMPSGCTLNIFDFGGNGAYNGEQYANALSKVQPYMNAALKERIDFSSMQGVIVPTSISTVSVMNTTFGKDIMELLNTDNWWAGMLGAFGVNFCFSTQTRFENKTLAISGQWLKNLTPPEIEFLLSNNKVILDAKAVVCLLEMNLGKLVNISSYEILEGNEDIFSYQEETFDNLGIKSARAPSQFDCGKMFSFNYNENVKTLTEMKHRLGKTVCKGITSPKENIMILNYEGYNRQSGLLHPLIEKIITAFLLGDSVFHVKESGVSAYKYESNNAKYENNTAKYESKNAKYESNNAQYFLFVNFTLDDYSELNIEGDFLLKDKNYKISFLSKEETRFNPCEDKIINNSKIKIALSSLSTLILKVETV